MPMGGPGRSFGIIWARAAVATGREEDLGMFGAGPGGLVALGVPRLEGRRQRGMARGGRGR